MIGCDIVFIPRIEKIYARHGERFLDRFLSEEEKKLIKNPSSLAGFFAAKEATLKALGTGISMQSGFLDVRIIKDERNAPFVRLRQSLVDKFKIKSSSLSISHDGNFAIAVVVLESEQEFRTPAFT